MMNDLSDCRLDSRIRIWPVIYLDQAKCYPEPIEEYHLLSEIFELIICNIKKLSF